MAYEKRTSANPLVAFTSATELLVQKTFSLVYILAGEENYLATEFIQSLITHSLDEEERQFNLDILDGKETPADKVFTFARQLPAAQGMFSSGPERRVVIIRGFELGRKKSNEELCFNYLGNPTPTTILVLEMPKLETKSELFKKISSKTTVIICEPLNDVSILSWLEIEFKKQKRNASQAVCSKLQSYVGNSLNDLSQAIAKIILFAGTRIDISEKDVEEIIGNSRTYDVWKLQKSVAEKNLPRSMEILQRLLATGSEPIALVAMLSGLFIRGMQSKPTYGERPVQYSYAEMHNALYTLLLTDEKLKSSSADKEMWMTQLLHQIVPHIKK